MWAWTKNIPVWGFILVLLGGVLAAGLFVLLAWWLWGHIEKIYDGAIELPRIKRLYEGEKEDNARLRQDRVRAERELFKERTTRLGLERKLMRIESGDYRGESSNLAELADDNLSQIAAEVDAGAQGLANEIKASFRRDPP
jgi:hypothetical protein